MSVVRWSRLFLTICVCGVGASLVPGVASAEPSKYLGAQSRHTLDQQELNDRASLAVNVANGNLVVTFNDIRINGRGLDLAISRTYNSGGSGSGAATFGGGWTSSLGAGHALEGLPNDDLTWRGPTGETYTFDKRADGTYASPAGANAKLEDLAGGDAQLTFDRSGTKLRFERQTSVSLRLDKVVDRNGNQITVTGNAGLATVTDTQGRQLTFTYDTDADIYLESIADSTGRQWFYGHDANGRLTTYRDPEVYSWAYGYDAAGRLTSIVDQYARDTRITYDTSDRVTSVTRRIDGTTTNDVTTTYSYPAVTAPCSTAQHAFMTVVTDPRGGVTTYCADADRQVRRVKNALNQETTQSYTPNGDISDFTDLVGTGQPPQTTLTYDSATNNLTGGTLGAGEAFSQKYCGSAGEPTCASLGFPTAPYAPTRFVDTEGADTLFGYDSRGNLTDVKDAPTPRNRATLTYNADGTVASATDGRGNTTTFTYYTTPAVQAGNLRKVTPPAPLGETTFAYDNLGRVSLVTDGRGIITSYTYDRLDRVKRVQDYTGAKRVEFTYDNNGNLTQRVSTTAGTTTYTYDTLNRRTSETFPGGVTNTYTYDKNSNLRTLTDPSGSVTYGYDAIDRVVSIAAPKASGTGTDTVSYTYTDTPTAADPTTKVRTTLPGSARIDTTINASGRPSRIEARSSTSALLSLRNYSYLEGSAVRSSIQSVTDEAGAKTTYTYEDAALNEDVGRLARARTETSAGALVEQYAYAYDEAGNRTRQTRTTPGGSLVTSYAYNAANQLCWRAYTTSSNPCGSPPTGAITFSYDGAGNQLSGGSATPVMTYDQLGRVSAIAGTAVQTLGESNNELTSFGARSYLNSLLGLNRETSGGSVTSIVRHPESGLPVSETQGGVKRFFVQDAIGSTTGMLDPASGGSIARRFAYTPYGEDTTTGSGPTTNQRFAGGHRLAGTILYHFGARFYDPSNGRWTQLDPVSQFADLTNANRYGYAGGDPVNRVDRSGLFPNPWDIAKCAAAIGGTVFIGAKIYRAVKALGGVKDAAKLLIGAGNVDDAIAAGGAAAAQLTGIVAVKEACF
jgi:RHS repeat-associated protein